MAGQLIIAGAGIAAIAHLTTETIGYIRAADHVFYHATSGVMATKILSLNPNATDLYTLYGEDKVRTKTYVQMCELMLMEVRAGKTVVGLFHGHPGFFVKAGRRALAIADAEGYPTFLIPGVSTPDCLLADLRIDPGFIGVQIMKASHVLRDGAILAADNHLILLQVSSVGDNRFSFSGYKHARVEELFEKLISIYGPQHEAVNYIAAIFPGLSPVIDKRTLGEFADPGSLATISGGSLYLPPIGTSVSSIVSKQAFKLEPYGEMERKAIAELEGMATPVSFKYRKASASLMAIMEELGGDPSKRASYVTDPVAFLTAFEGLDDNERLALIHRDSGLLRLATTDVVEFPGVAGNTFEGLLEKAPSNLEFKGYPPDTVEVPMTMRWSSEHQFMEFGGRRFEHHGPTETDPSHDLAHLLVAANGGLPWMPEGDPEQIRLAEFCTVFVEHLLDNTFNAIHGQARGEGAIASTIAYAKWFVERHFAPFPISFDEAYRGLLKRLKPETIAPLSLYFFRQKLGERSNPEYRSEHWTVSIDLQNPPKSRDASEDTFAQKVRQYLLEMQAEDSLDMHDAGSGA